MEPLYAASGVRRSDFAVASHRYDGAFRPNFGRVRLGQFFRRTFRGTKGSVDNFAVSGVSEAIVRPQVESSACDPNNKADPAKTGGASEIESEARQCKTGTCSLTEVHRTVLFFFCGVEQSGSSLGS